MTRKLLVTKVMPQLLELPPEERALTSEVITQIRDRNWNGDGPLLRLREKICKLTPDPGHYLRGTTTVGTKFRQCLLGAPEDRPDDCIFGNGACPLTNNESTKPFAVNSLRLLNEWLAGELIQESALGGLSFRPVTPVVYDTLALCALDTTRATSKGLATLPYQDYRTNLMHGFLQVNDPVMLDLFKGWQNPGVQSLTSLQGTVHGILTNDPGTLIDLGLQNVRTPGPVAGEWLGTRSEKRYPALASVMLQQLGQGHNSVADFIAPIASGHLESL